MKTRQHLVIQTGREFARQYHHLAFRQIQRLYTSLGAQRMVLRQRHHQRFLEEQARVHARHIQGSAHQAKIQRLRQEQRAFVGQLDPVPVTLEQLRADIFLLGTYLRTQGRLDDVQARGLTSVV